jgi:hypothetical protein
LHFLLDDGPRDRRPGGEDVEMKTSRYSRRREGAFALVPVLSLVLLSVAGAAATSGLSRQASRRLGFQRDRLERRRRAEDALREVSRQATLNSILEDPLARDLLLVALADGERRGGAVHVDEVALEVDATTAPSGEPERRISSVRVTPLLYSPGRNLGVLRFAVDVGPRVGARGPTRTYVQDYDFALRGEVDAALRIVLPRAPRARIYP